MEKTKGDCWVEETNGDCWVGKTEMVTDGWEKQK